MIRSFVHSTLLVRLMIIENKLFFIFFPPQTLNHFLAKTIESNRGSLAASFFQFLSNE